MTEAEWESCDDFLRIMILLKRRKNRIRPWTTRKARLFACACCRRIWSLLTPEDRAAVEAAEDVADGLLKLRELEKFREAAQIHRVGNPTYPSLVEPARHAAAPSILSVAWWAANDVCVWLSYARSAEESSREASFQRDLLRDVAGPSPHSLPIDPVWLAHKNETIRGLTTSLYNDRAFDRLPILGDALEDAGCTDAAILDHCRGPGPHVRGCWVVDIILDKH